MEKLGLIQVYTGKGKGKTTAALGLATRAIGHGLKVQMVQFLKGSAHSGELFAAHRLFPQLQITQFGWGCPLSSLIRSGQAKCRKCGECFRKNRDITTNLARPALEYAKSLIRERCCDLLILDEISHPLRHRLLEAEEVCNLLKAKPTNLEIVLTGREMPQEIIELADLVTEVFPQKHPFQAGIDSRRGIEY